MTSIMVDQKTYFKLHFYESTVLDSKISNLGAFWPKSYLLAYFWGYGRKVPRFQYDVKVFFALHELNDKNNNEGDMKP